MSALSAMPTQMLRDAQDGTVQTMHQLRKLGEHRRIPALRALNRELQDELLRRLPPRG